jgi:hypothetical protein
VGDGLRGEGAVRASAVGHHLLIPGHLGESLLELFQRDRDRAGNVTGRELLGWPDVDQEQLLA